MHDMRWGTAPPAPLPGCSTGVTVVPVAEPRYGPHVADDMRVPSPRGAL